MTAPPGLTYRSATSSSPLDSAVPTRTTARSPVTGFSITSPAFNIASSSVRWVSVLGPSLPPGTAQAHRHCPDSSAGGAVSGPRTETGGDHLPWAANRRRVPTCWYPAGDGGSRMSQDPDVPFGAHLRRLREASGFTQEELAARSRLSTDAVSALERGLRKRP